MEKARQEEETGMEVLSRLSGFESLTLEDAFIRMRSKESFVLVLFYTVLEFFTTYLAPSFCAQIYIVTFDMINVYMGSFM